ncbi:MAG: RNA polymerase sigma factor [bacterium]
MLIIENSTLTDQQAVERILAGDKEVFRVLVERYRVSLFSFLWRFTNHREESEDLTQETFLKAYLNLKRYDPARRFSTWLFTIGHRLAINRWKSLRLKLVELEEAHEVRDTGPDPLAVAIGVERREEISRALALLSEQYRLSLSLYYLSDQSIKDIALVTGAPESTVKTWLHRGRKALLDVIDLKKVT